MSKLTQNLLRSLDYEKIKRTRTENYAYLYNRLGKVNQLTLRLVDGAFAYPLLMDNARMLKKKLLEKSLHTDLMA